MSITLISKYLKKDRENMFPWIKDFTDPQDVLRNADTRNITYWEWLWFHPSAFSLIRIGSPIVSFFVFAISLFLVIMSGASMIFLVISLVMSMLMLYKSYEEIYYKSYMSGVTLFDYYIRDYFVDGGKDGQKNTR